MRRFLVFVSLFLVIPLTLLAVLYSVSDPYKTIKPFSLHYFDDTNRDYLSSELFLKNYPEQQYDSFIFGSSRGCGINTYHWAEYLPAGSKPFLFQAWGETLTGIEQKITFIDKHNCGLKNVLVLIDIPGTFNKDQIPTRALALKHPAFTGQPRWIHQMILFYDFIQKPSQWLRAFHLFFHPQSPDPSFDSVTNDWDKENKYLDVSSPPEKDSLNNISPRAKSVFLKEVSERLEEAQEISMPLIDKGFEHQLRNIREIFEKRGSDYRIIITPGFSYTNPAISKEDETLLQDIFGKENVFDFSKRNELNSDYNNYSDPNHFGLYVGWYVIEEVYHPTELYAR